MTQPLPGMLGFGVPPREPIVEVNRRVGDLEAVVKSMSAVLTAVANNANAAAATANSAAATAQAAANTANAAVTTPTGLNGGNPGTNFTHDSAFHAVFSMTAACPTGYTKAVFSFSVNAGTSMTTANGGIVGVQGVVSGGTSGSVTGPSESSLCGAGGYMSATSGVGGVITGFVGGGLLTVTVNAAVGGTPQSSTSDNVGVTGVVIWSK